MQALMPGHMHGRRIPRPMGGFHYLHCAVFVASQALFGNILRRFKRIFDIFCSSDFHKQGEVNYLFDGYLASCYFKNVSNNDKFNANIKFYYVNGSYETFLTNKSNFSFIVSKYHSLMDVSLNLSNDKEIFILQKKIEVNFITSDQYSSKRMFFFSFMGAFLSLILLVLPSFVSRWKKLLSLR